MICNYCWKKIVPFTLTFLVGLFAAISFQTSITVNKIEKDQNSCNRNIYEEGNGIGSSGGEGSFTDKASKKSDSITNSLRIISKPRANYTDTARQNNIQGTVTLRVTFLASGQIGNISTVSGLPCGLTEQAIAAAAKIKFEPMLVNGNPSTVTKQVQYSFTIY